ncbi:MAG: C25 family cysteine peptidase [Thermoplasmatota archaeon]
MKDTVRVLVISLLLIFGSLVFGGAAGMSEDVLEAHGDPMGIPTIIDEPGTGTITLPIDYPAPELANGLYGREVRMGGIGLDSRSSYMRLPIQVITFPLPVGTAVESVVISEPLLGSMRMDHISCNPPSVPSVHGADPDPEAPDPRFPEDHLEWEIKTTIDPATSESAALLIVRIHPAVPRGGHLDILRSGVLLVHHRIPMGLNAPAAAQGPYDLLVVCTDDFRSRVEEYCDYRNATGTNTMLVTMEEIGSDVHFDIQENDTQEELKRFIYTARLQWGIDYVMLAGDADIIPARHILVLDGYDDNGAGMVDGAFVPSDLYYSDLFERGTLDFSSWNSDVSGDHRLLYGEWDTSARDDPDLYPDVYVGRLPASTLTELDRMLDRIVGYELSAKGADWMNNVTLCGTNTFTYNPTPEGEYTCDYIASTYLSGYNLSKFYETQGTLVRENISASINSGAGLVIMSDHGEYDGWGYTSQYPSGTFRSNQVDLLSNDLRLPVVILDACLTHGFDNENASDSTTGKDPVYDMWYYPPGLGLSVRDSMGEYFHTARYGGAIATYGCTRVGYGSTGASYPFSVSGYMNSHITKALTDGYNRPGQMLARAVADYLTNLGTSGVNDYKTVTEYVLLGDPSATVGGINPILLDITVEDEEPEILPGTEMNLSFSVRNQGLVQADLTLGVEVLDNGRIVWTANLSDVNVSIPAGGSFEGNLSIYTPENALAGSTREVVISADSYLLLAPQIESIRPKAALTWGLSAEAPDDLHAAQGSEDSGYFHITNLGNSMERMNLSYHGVPEGFEIFTVSNEVEVEPFETYHVPFKITLPDLFLAGIYPLILQVNSSMTPASNRTVFNMTVDVEHDLLIEIPGSRVKVRPEQTKQMDVMLFNMGNINTPVELEFSGSHMEGWNISFDRSSIDMDPFSNESVEISIGIPNGTGPGIYSLLIKASGGGLTVQSTLELEVLRVYGFILSCECPLLDIQSGGEVEFALDVENIGNYFDKYNISFTNPDPDNFTISPSPQIFSVQNASSKEIFIKVGIKDPVSGDYVIPITAAPWSGIGPQQVVIALRVVEKFDLSVSGGFLNDRAKPLQPFIARFYLVNEGNTNDTFGYTVEVPEGWTSNLSSKAVNLSAKGVLTIDAAVTPPQGALAGLRSVRLRITSAGMNETTVFSWTVQVAEVYDLVSSLMISDEPYEVRPGNVYNIPILIRNLGNADENVEIGISASGIREWVTLSTYQLSLVPPGENRTVEMIMSVPSNMTKGEYSISIFISGNGDTEAVRHNITISVKERGGKTFLEGVDFLPVLLTLLAGIMLIIIVAFLLVRLYRKSSGVDISDAGMEWEEEDGEGDEEEDWDLE